MAERSGFFNALFVGGEYDRKYNANDYSDNLATIISNGVRRSSADDLKVTGKGMVCTVAAGRAWIDGHYYKNDSPISFTAPTAPAGGTRWDRVVLRLDTSVDTRSINLRYVIGTAANAPTKPAPVREGGIYELVLADVFVGTNAAGVIVYDKRGDNDVCGWVYSTAGDNSFFETLDKAFDEWFTNTKDTLASVTLFKRYSWRTVLTTAGNKVAFSIPQYDPETCFVEVYVNGLLVTAGTDYTLSGSSITFTNSLQANTEIDVLCFKSIDGTGIMSAANEITELQNQMAQLNAAGEYSYICNGVDDNVQLSNLAMAWLEGGTDYSSRTIKVYGTFGATAPYGGDGSVFFPYEWFRVAGDNYANRKIILDFSCCTQLNIPIKSGTFNYVFAGIDAHIIGADVYAYNKDSGTCVVGFSTTGGAVYCENCRFWLTGYNNCKVACTGTFVNCRASVANSTENSYCFDTLGAGLLRLQAGQYMAYTGAASAVSAIVGQTASTAVSILNGVNAPIVERAGYYQTNSIYQTNGSGNLNCRELVSTLPLIVASSGSVVAGTITRGNKTHTM